MLYNPFNALSLLDFSVRSRRARLLRSRPFAFSPAKSEPAEVVRGRGDERGKSCLGVGNYVADVN